MNNITTYRWIRIPVTETRGALSDTENDAGIRAWAEQILTAYRYGRDPDVLYEIWQQGNRAEKRAAMAMMRRMGHRIPVNHR